MKRVLFTFAVVLLLSSFKWPAVTVADGNGPFANGNFQISMENGQSREIKFNARLARDGSTSGEITFRDDVSASESKSSGNSNTGEAAPFYAKAVCDCLVVKGIEAVIGGTITEASLENYIGRRVLLVVQDGDSITPPLRDKGSNPSHPLSASRLRSD
jgi:hypothetical protein